MKPPIVPVKKIDSKNMQDGEVNPYALLNYNFDKKIVDKDIDLFDNKYRNDGIIRKSFQSDISKDSGHVSNFTFDRDNCNTFQRKMGSNCTASPCMPRFEEQQSILSVRPESISSSFEGSSAVFRNPSLDDA